MTPEQVELMRSAARNLLAHHEAGRKCDPHAVEWAKWVTRTDWPACQEKRNQDQQENPAHE